MPVSVPTTLHVRRLILIAVFLIGLSAEGQVVKRVVPFTDPGLVKLDNDWDKAYRLQDYPAAIAASLQGLSLAREMHSKPGVLQFVRHLAYDNWLMGNLELSIDYSQQLLDLAAKEDSTADLSRAHRYLSQVYESMGDLPHAREHADQALRLADLTNDKSLHAFALEAMGHSELQAKNFVQARRDIEQVRAYWQGVSRVNATNSLRDLGDISAAEGDLTSALAAYFKVEDETQAVGDQRGLTRTLYRASVLLRRLGRIDEAAKQLDRARPLAKAVGGHQILSEFHAEEAHVLEAQGNFKAALEEERIAAAEREALISERTQVRAVDFESRLEFSKKEEAIGVLAREKSIQAALLREREAELRARTAELSEAGTVRWMVLGGVLLGAVALGAVILAQRARLRAEHRLHTETRQAKETAEEADRIKTRFLGVASHDIRGPLGNIVNLAEGLRSAPRDPASNRVDLDLILAEAQRVLTLLEDLVTHAALEAGKLELQTAPMDLAAVVRSVLTSLGWQAIAKNQLLSLATPAPGAGMIVGDFDRLYQVVANLVGNAVKFSPPGKPIEISLTRNEQFVTLAVRDEGPGMTSHAVSRLFLPFTRLGARPTGGEFSHGLGLSIAQEIVRLHGGTIRVESTPALGTTFLVNLPLG